MQTKKKEREGEEDLYKHVACAETHQSSHDELENKCFKSDHVSSKIKLRIYSDTS